MSVLFSVFLPIVFLVLLFVGVMHLVRFLVRRFLGDR